MQVRQPLGGVALDPAGVVGAADHLEQVGERGLEQRHQGGCGGRGQGVLQLVDGLVRAAAVVVGFAPVEVPAGPQGPQERDQGGDVTAGAAAQPAQRFDRLRVQAIELLEDAEHVLLRHAREPGADRFELRARGCFGTGIGQLVVAVAVGQERCRHEVLAEGAADADRARARPVTCVEDDVVRRGAVRGGAHQVRGAGRDLDESPAGVVLAAAERSLVGQFGQLEPHGVSMSHLDPGAADGCPQIARPPWRSGSSRRSLEPCRDLGDASRRRRRPDQDHDPGDQA